MLFDAYGNPQKYNVIVTSAAEADLDRFLAYLLYKKKNHQAAENVLDDFEKTVQKLSSVAGSLKLDDNKRFAKLGYRRIHFEKHNYFFLYRIHEDNVTVDRMYHDLQDYQNMMQV